jgi:hypothetical protein
MAEDYEITVQFHETECNLVQPPNIPRRQSTTPTIHTPYVGWLRMLVVSIHVVRYNNGVFTMFRHVRPLRPLPEVCSRRGEKVLALFSYLQLMRLDDNIRCVLWSIPRRTTAVILPMPPSLPQEMILHACDDFVFIAEAPQLRRAVGR